MTTETTATKTLKATLAPPTTGKEHRLQRTVATYRRALSDAFESGAGTQSAVNDVVTPYTLTAYAKDALKNYVPQLRDSYDAQELSEDHPVRFTKRGWQFDHSPDRHHEFCWRVPQAGRGNAFWIPLRINPAQESLWFDLLSGEVDNCEFRLQEHRTNWVLHVTVEYDVPEPETPDDPTYIGFDIGESKLLTGCALTDDGAPTQPYFYDGSRARHLRKEMFTTLRRLQQRDADWRIEERFEHYQNALTDIVEKASRQAVEYAQQFENPVIALEDLTYIREHLDYGTFMNRRLHAWAFARLQGRIEDKALDTGIPVESVPPAYTSQTCHACNHIGRRPRQAEFRCTHSSCWVSEYQSDINAAAKIASRVNPWGESLSWKSAADDFLESEAFQWSGNLRFPSTPQDGSTFDSTTVYRETSPQSGQMTLTAFQD